MSGTCSIVVLQYDDTHPCLARSMCRGAHVNGEEMHLTKPGHRPARLYAATGIHWPSSHRRQGTEHWQASA